MTKQSLVFEHEAQVTIECSSSFVLKLVLETDHAPGDLNMVRFNPRAIAWTK